MSKTNYNSIARRNKYMIKPNYSITITTDNKRFCDLLSIFGIGPALCRKIKEYKLPKSAKLNVTATDKLTEQILKSAIRDGRDTPKKL